MRNYLALNFIPIYIYYFWYVLKHKWFVGIECFKRGLIWQGIIHDWQKFTPTEFFAYALFYNGPWSRGLQPKWLCDAYYRAVEHHYDKGPHHWNHWAKEIEVGQGVKTWHITEMPVKYMEEMMADWSGTGKSLHGLDESKTWYAKHYDDVKMHPNSRAYVDAQMRG